MQKENEVQRFVQEVRQHGWKAEPNPMAWIMEIIHERPERLSLLLHTIIDELPKGGTYMDAALSYLPLDEFPALIRHALDALPHDPKNAAAEAVIEYASLQCLPALRPYLETIFTLGLDKRIGYAKWSWRDADASAEPFLRPRFENQAEPETIREAAWRAALETRDTDLLTAAWASPTPTALRIGQNNYLWMVDFEMTENGLRRLCPESVCHLRFMDQGYPHHSAPNATWFPSHPTWHLMPDSPTMTFGGRIEAAEGETPLKCALCGGILHHLLTLDPIPNGFGVTGLERLTLAVCLSCLGWETGAHTLFYQHDPQGQITANIGYLGPTIVPKFPAEPFPPTQVHLALTPERWRWQEWGPSNDRENLHRVGGHPSWVQSAEYPTCPCCTQTMCFLMQLDSELRSEDKCGYWFWGSGGLAYLFWCDTCKVSAVLWQCT